MIWIWILSAGLASAEVTTMNATVRALGMGNAFTALARDPSSLFYNPAGLAALTGVHVELASIRAGTSALAAYQDVKGVSGGDQAQFSNAVQKLYGKTAWVGVGAESVVTLPGFAFAGYDHFDGRVAVDNPVYPSLYAGLINDYGYAAGYGIPLDDQLSFGVVARYVRREGTRQTFGPSIVASLDADQLKSQFTGWGTGYGVDLGLDYDIPFDDWRLTAGAAWRNVGQLRFTSKNGTVLPFDDNEVTVGLAGVIEAPGLKVRPSVDCRYLNWGALPLGMKLGAGVEVSFPALDVRGGFSQGYYTLGAGIDFGLFRADAATYGVELGSYPGQLEDRRYVAELTMSLDLSDAFRRREGRLKRRR